MSPPVFGQDPPSSERPVPLSIVRDSLPNGLHIIYTRVNELPLVEWNLIIHAGAANDPAGKEGLAAMTAQVLLSDAPRGERPPIPATLAQLASSMTTYAGAEYSQIYARSLARHALQALDMLVEIARNPALTPDAIREKARVMQTGISSMNRGAGEAVTRALLAGMYGPSHPAVRMSDMSSATVNALTLDDVQRFHRTWYVPGNMTLIITGNVEYASLRDVIADRFANWASGSLPISTATMPAHAPGMLLVVEDTPQQVVPMRVAIPGPARNDPRATAYLVLNHILGEGRASRLFRAFWGDRFIHPSFQSDILFFRDASTIIVSGNAPVRLADSVSTIVMGVVEAIAANGVTNEELASAKLALAGTSMYEFTTNRKVQSLLQDAVTNAYDPMHITRFKQEVDAVTIADLQAIASELTASQKVWMAISGSLPALHGASRTFFGERVREVARTK